MVTAGYKSTEWPTLLSIAICYACWLLATTIVSQLSAAIGIAACAILIAFHSSLQHEVIHGHPLRSRFWSEILVFPAVGLLIPYERFRETHLQHHFDPNLTDPYEDPETNYMDPEVWQRLSPSIRTLLRFNNLLLGRVLVGPAISMYVFVRSDMSEMKSGKHEIMRSWLLHLVGTMPVLAWIGMQSPLSVIQYFIAAYLGLALLKIRTFLEHRAHERPRGRTVVIDDRGPLALLFLNNNFHLVHHMQPGVPWYRLPQLFDRDRERYLGCNDGYFYKTYKEVFVKHLLAAKDPVPHPIWKRE